MPCGIAGFVGLSDKALLTRMLAVQRHRGPDSTGEFVDSGIGLGTDRLKIIDIEKGDQPIHNEDGSVWITYNGEVYNYLELRAELEKGGHHFYTQSDTETIVHAYESWGISFLQHLRGMFAFGLWDATKRKLILARDRLGKKPLYYSLSDGILLFSSELKGILQYDGFSREVDWEAIDHFFTYSYIPSPMTAFKHVRKLPPGHYLVYDGQKAEIARYWEMNFRPTEQDEDTVIDKLYEIISEAVRIRLRSDVPLGAFLSGGIDSSVVTALMAKHSPEPVKTVTVGFEEADEHIRMGRLVAQKLGTDHSEHIVDTGSFELLPDLLWHFDEPFADSSLIPTYQVSKMVRREAKVALTGDGGDEMFMGYDFLRDPSVYGVYKTVPAPLRRAGLNLLSRWPGHGEWKKMANYALQRDYGAQDYFGRYLLRSLTFTPEELPALYGRPAPSAHPLAFLESSQESCASRDPLDVMSLATMKGYLSEMILPKVDRMAMAVSLEPRSPLLDHVLAEFVGTIPSGMKYRHGTTKYIFKKMATKKNLVPREVVDRRKVGFGAPIGRWMGNDWKGFSDQVLERVAAQKFFSPAYIAKISGDRYLNSGKIFCAVIFTLWYSQYVEGDPVAPKAVDSLLSS